jgi:hypothetical protein
MRFGLDPDSVSNLIRAKLRLEKSTEHRQAMYDIEHNLDLNTELDLKTESSA